MKRTKKRRRLDGLLALSTNMYLLVVLLAFALWQCGYL